MSVSYRSSGSAGPGSGGGSGCGPGGGGQYRIPDELQEILLDFTVNYLIEQPTDIARFESQSFHSESSKSSGLKRCKNIL